MGTRNLSLLKINGELKVKQYGQWDGYPSGQGVTVLKFCMNKENIERLRQLAPTIKNVKDFDKWEEFAEYYNKAFENNSLTDNDKYYFNSFLSRNVCANIFENIINLNKNELPSIFNKELYLQEYESYEGDTLENYCDIWIEYAYLINLDTNKLECYGDRKLLKIFSLDNLPTKEDFIEQLNKETDEE